jgi:hypothetical protein
MEKIMPIPYKSVRDESLAKGRVLRKARLVWGRRAHAERQMRLDRDGHGKIVEPRVRRPEYWIGHVAPGGLPMFYVLGSGTTWEDAWAHVRPEDKRFSVSFGARAET